MIFYQAKICNVLLVGAKGPQMIFISFNNISYNIGLGKLTIFMFEVKLFSTGIKQHHVIWFV